MPIPDSTIRLRRLIQPHIEKYFDKMRGTLIFYKVAKKIDRAYGAAILSGRTNELLTIEQLSLTLDVPVETLRSFHRGRLAARLGYKLQPSSKTLNNTYLYRLVDVCDWEERVDQYLHERYQNFTVEAVDNEISRLLEKYGTSK